MNAASRGRLWSDLHTSHFVAFARRGLGYSAVQGTTSRDDNRGSVPATLSLTLGP